jgi:hypothetical protein
VREPRCPYVLGGIGGVAERKIAASRPVFLIGELYQEESEKMQERKQRMTTRWPKSAATDEIKWKGRIQFTRDALAAAWAAFIGRIAWSHSITLTFDPKKRYPVSRELASREAFRWLNQLAADSRSPVGWVYATERGKTGHWHVHALVTGVHVGALEHVVRSWELRNGIAHVMPVDDTEGAVMYLTKNAALDGEVVLSDTISHYKDKLMTEVVVELHPSPTPLTGGA